jgi:Flp pilus assembly protein TadG
VKGTVEAAAGDKPARRGMLARFARDRRGVAALEFGMVSIPFLGLLCAIFETAFVFYTQEVFDNTVAHVAREILVNQYSTTQQTMSSFLNASGSNGYSLCGSLPSYFQCANIRVNIATADSFGDVSAISNSFISNPQASTNLTVPAAGSIVVFQAYYPMPVYLSILLASGPHGNQVSTLYSPGMVHNIFSVAVFRNEPATSS